MAEKKLRLLTAADVDALADCKTTDMDVPEWGHAVRMRELPAGDGIALNDAMQALPRERAADSMYLLLAAVIVDGEGKPVFTPDQLRSRNAKVLSRLQDQALNIQGWRKGDEAAAKNGSGEAAAVASPTA